jgi:phage shock protein A
VEAFRAQKEMVKAQVQIQESATGISEEMADVNLAVQRAQDKVTQMQGRASARDELIASGTLAEADPGAQDGLDRQHSAFSDTASVNKQLAELKARMQLPAGSPPPQLPSAAGGGSSSREAPAETQSGNQS